MIFSVFLQVDGPFSIGSSSGIIRLTGSLDFTVQSQYNVLISAQVTYMITTLMIIIILHIIGWC